MKKKIIISVLAVLIVVSSCIGIIINSKSNDDSSTNKTDSSTTSNITTTVHTTNETTTKPVETTTKETTTAKSTTQKSSSSQKQSGASGSSKNNSSQKQTTKKNTITSKKETTTKAKSYAMSASEIRNYALDQIAKIDGTIYDSEMNINNSGWNTPLIIEPGDSKEDIKEGIRGQIWWYNGTTKNGYNVYVENSTYWHATISSSGELTEYNTPCIKVYFLYGQIYTGPPIIEAE